MRKILSFAASCAAGAALLACICSAPVHAQGSAFWHGVVGPLWEDGIGSGGTSNWYSAAPPNGDPREVPDKTATFAPGAVRQSVRFLQDASIETMRFVTGVEEYSFNLNGSQLEITGQGIINGAATTPLFIVTESALLHFQGAASIEGGVVDIENAGQVLFEGSTSGGAAILENTQKGAKLVFRQRSSADDMFITNNGGAITFSDRSTGEDAVIRNFRGRLVFGGLGPAGDRALSTGSITNEDSMNVGTNLLTVRGTLRLQGNSIVTVKVSAKEAGTIIANDAMLKGTLIIDGDGKTKKTKVTILSATGARMGKFANVIFGSSFDGRNGRISYQGNVVSILLDPL